MLIHRIVSSVVLITVLLVTIFIAPKPLVALVIGLVIGIGLWEFYRLVEVKGFRPFKIFGIASGIILSIGTYYNLDTNLVLSSILLITLIKYIFKKEDNFVIVNSAVTMLGILYVSYLFTFIIKISFIPNPQDGKILVLAFFIITKSSDICAYIVGIQFGRHKLIPRISANKSVEGTIGGVLGAMIVSMLFGRGLWLGVLLSVVGQVGDLVESLIKRDAQVKDSGRLVPGMGGVLDFMDSLLFAGPVMYFLVRG